MSGKTPSLGFGVGLRRAHFDSLFEHASAVDWVEVLADNFLGHGGRLRAVLDRTAATFPVALHSVGLSIGSVDPLDETYLDGLRELAGRSEARWVSDHLCFSSAFGTEFHELLPLPCTDETVRHVVDRVRRVQDRLDVPFLLENPSYYLHLGGELSEAEFISEVVLRSGCGLLLDVNNVFVNATNHGYDPRDFIRRLPLDRVGQLHLAGHAAQGQLLIDTHGSPVRAEVLDLYGFTLSLTGPVSTLLEWDNEVPPIEVLLRELEAIREVAGSVLWAREASA